LLPLSLAEAPKIAGADYFVVVVIAAIAAGALVFAYFLYNQVMRADQGTPRMQDIARAVQEGAAAYLNRQFKTLSAFVLIVFVLLLILPVNEGGANVRIGRSIFFVVGAIFSALVGYFGMTLATRGNVRVAAAARAGGARNAMRIAFRTGGFCGMLTVGLGLLGASGVLLIYNNDAPTVLEGFGFGAALLAMFMRVGGGIFTKAADVGADLVGKVEQGIPEDDPRNAATIADNVGDNVGDCAGMAADLFESYEVTLVAALILGNAAFGIKGVIFPLIVRGIGVLTSILGIFAVSPRDSDRNGMKAINRGFFEREITPYKKNDGTIVSKDDCPRAGTTLAKLATLYLHNDNFTSKAIEYLDEAMALSPRSADLHNLRGIAYSKAGDGDRADADFRKVTELSPRAAEAHMNRGVDFLRQGEAPSGAALEALDA